MIQTFFNGFLHYSPYIDYSSINCVPQLAKKGVVLSDSPVPVAKIDTEKGKCTHRQLQTNDAER
jgi:hypothetical protein